MHLFLSALLVIAFVSVLCGATSCVWMRGFRRVLAAIAAWIKDGDVISIDGKALRGARARKQSTRMRMMVSAGATQWRLTLAPVPADGGRELDAAIEALGLIAVKGKVVTGDALHFKVRNRLAERWPTVIALAPRDVPGS